MQKKSHLQRMPVRASPFAHQQAAFNFACAKFGLDGKKSSGGVALLMEMGTGKSMTAIAVAGALYLPRKIDRLLIVCPLSITGVWREEFEKFADFPYTLTVLSGTGEKRKSALHCVSGSGLQVAVINYESCWRMEKELSDWNPDMIIADEGHKIKTHNAAASKALHRLGATAEYRMLLTGTPFTNKAIDIFSQYKFLEPAIPGDDPDAPETAREFSAVILYQHPLNAYYKSEYQGGSNPPDCGIFDGHNGDGDPGGCCDKCPLNQYGSGKNGAKACKNRRRLYLLREGEIFPMILSLPTGSLKGFTRYLMRILPKYKNSNAVVTRFTLKRASSNTGIAYSQAQFAVDRALTSEEYTLVSAMTEQVKALSVSVGYDTEEGAAAVDPGTGEVVEPLA